jgi:hypothetical protein
MKSQPGADPAGDAARPAPGAVRVDAAAMPDATPSMRSLGDGRAQVILGVMPTRFLDDDGTWRPVSNALVPAGGGGWQNRTNTLRSFLPAAATGPMAVERRGGSTLAFVPLGMAWCDSAGACSPRVAPSPVGGEADPRVPGHLVYRGVHPDVDEAFSVSAIGVKQDIVLAAPPAAPAGAGFVSFAWDLRLSRDLFPVVDGRAVRGEVETQGWIRLRDGGGEVRMAIAPPHLLARAADPHFADRALGTYRLAPSGGRWRLELLAPVTWLSDPARGYPVSLDPTVVVQPDEDAHTGSVGFDGDMSYGRQPGRIVSGTLASIDPTFQDASGYARFPTAAADCLASVEDVDLLVWLANHDNFGVTALPLAMEVRAAAADPATATDQELFDAIGAGVVYAGDTIANTTGASGGWCLDAYEFHEYELGAAAATDFTTALGAGSFTIGFRSEIGEDPDFDHIDYIGYPEDVPGGCGFEPFLGSRISLRVTGMAKAAPVADAGGPYAASCAAADAAVQLDASASTGTGLSFSWITDCPGGTFDDALSPAPVLSVPMGGVCSMACTATVTVSDACATSMATAAVALGDAESPGVASGPLDGACLWSPNHKYVCTTDLAGLVAVTDECSDVALTVVGCSSDQPDEAPDPGAPGENGDGHTTNDCVLAPDGGALCVRGERLGTDETGRSYGVALLAADGCSPAAPFSASFFVAHDQRAPRQDCVDAKSNPFLEVRQDLPW